MTYFPKYFSRKAVLCYIFSVLIIALAFHKAAMPFLFYVIGFISVTAFFFGSSALTINWAKKSTRKFELSLFWTAFGIRLLVAFFFMFFNMKQYGQPHASDPGDIGWYIDTAQAGVFGLVNGENILHTWESWGILFSDMGYCLYLMIVYLISFNISPIALPLVLKAVWGALTCVLIYRMATRHFGESVGRMTGIFCMLQFNLIWWCGSMMKETELVFIFIWFAETIDKMIVERKYTIGNFVIIGLTLLLLFMFRTALGIVGTLAALLTGVFSSKRVVGAYRSVFITISVLGLLLIPGQVLLSTFSEEDADIENWKSSQVANMKFRAERQGGNSLAVYASATVFAPLIFTIPFPSLVYTDLKQEMLMLVNGGNFTKNILSVFVIFALFLLLLTKSWKDHIFPAALTCGYLFALVISSYAQSGRFHLPTIPLELMFAAWGASQMNTRTRVKWFDIFIVVEFAACIAWSWFKLKGRGLV